MVIQLSWSLPNSLWSVRLLGNIHRNLAVVAPFHPNALFANGRVAVAKILRTEVGDNLDVVAEHRALDHSVGRQLFEAREREQRGFTMKRREEIVVMFDLLFAFVKLGEIEVIERRHLIKQFEQFHGL